MAVPSSSSAGRAALAWLLAFFILVIPLRADDLDLTHLPPHPRLFADANRWAELREQVKTDDVSRRLFAALRAHADRLLSEPTVVLEREGRRLLTPVREAQTRVLTLAAAWRLTADARYAERALAEMRPLAHRDDWNPSHFLDTAEAAFALGVGYDWLYETLTPADRDLFERAIIEKGLRQSFEPDGPNPHWVAGTNNWNQVCHGGLVAGALAVAERDPALAERVVTRAIDNLHHAAAAYAPDGVYPEGPGYWDYGTTFHVALVAALDSALGNRHGLDAFPGFRESARYVNQMVGPTGLWFNYADNHERKGFQPVLFWFARELGDAGVVAWELDRLRDAPADDPEKGVRSYRGVTMALVWWDPALASQTAPPLPLSWLGRGHIPIAVHRSAWDDPSAVFLGFKAGTPGASHAHMDAGSFVLEADGVRWAIDLGMPNYHTLESAGVGLWDGKQEGGRWTVFALNSESHNIIRFNGAPQSVKGRAELLRSESRGGDASSVAELAAMYPGEVAAARRGVKLRGDRRVVIQDEWTAGDKPADATWQWLTRAAVEVQGDRATLRQGEKTLTLRVLEPAGAAFEVQDFSQPVRPFDAPNPDLKRIALNVTTPAGASRRLAVLAEPGSATSREAVAVKPLAEW